MEVLSIEEPLMSLRPDCVINQAATYNGYEDSIWRLGSIRETADKLHRLRLGSDICNKAGKRSRENNRRPLSVLDVRTMLFSYYGIVPKTIHKGTIGWRNKISAVVDKITMETSSKGGFDMAIGSYTDNGPRYSRIADILDYLEKKELGERIENINYYSTGSVNLNLEGSYKWDLKYLDLSHTRICELPHSLTSLASLEKITTKHNKMICSMKTSSEGGFDIDIGSYPIHVPKYSSVHYTLIQMVLFARTILYDGTLAWLEFVASKSFFELNKSKLVITKPKSHSPNTVSARKDVHAHADTALENHSVTPGLDKNIPKLEELDYNLNLSTVPVHSGGFPQENVYNLNSLTSAPNSADHGITKPVEEAAEVWRLANTAKAEDKTEVWLMATAALHHVTGNIDLLSGFTTVEYLFVKAGDGVSMPVCGRGSVITGTVILPDVWFVPGLTENLVSAAQLTELDYSVGFARGACIIRSATDGVVIGKARASEDGLFEVEFLKVQSVIGGE